MYVFKLPATGDWILRCSDGVKEDVRTINIPVMGIIINIELTYGVLYDSAGIASWTVGSVIMGSPSNGPYLAAGVTLTTTVENYVKGTMSSGGWPSGTVYWAEPITLDLYNLITINYSKSIPWYLYWCLWSAPPTHGGLYTTNLLLTSGQLGSGSGDATQTFNISSLTGNGYVGYIMQTGAQSTSTCTIKQLICSK